MNAIEVLRSLSKTVPDHDEGQVELLRRDGVWRLRINNPKAANSFTLKMMVELGEQVGILRESSGDLLLLSSTGKNFCAGAHLGDVKTGLLKPELGRQMSEAMSVVLQAISALPMFSVCHIQGAARGGGAELSLCTDLRWMDHDASVGFVHTRLSVVPGWGATPRLVTLLGPARASEVLAFSPVLCGRECVAMGLVNRCDVNRDLRNSLIKVLMNREPGVLRALKKQLLNKNPQVQVQAFGDVWAKEAHKKAITRALKRS